MSKQILNQFKGLFADGREVAVVASTIVDAATTLTSETEEPNLVQRTASGVTVLVPDANVAFLTAVSPAEAKTAGCVATPETYTVPSGQKVIFSAVPTTGWVFSEWRKDGVALSDSAVPPALLPAVTEITVTAGAGAYVTYTAVFVADVP